MCEKGKLNACLNVLRNHIWHIGFSKHLRYRFDFSLNFITFPQHVISWKLHTAAWQSFTYLFCAMCGFANWIEITTTHCHPHFFVNILAVSHFLDVKMRRCEHLQFLGTWKSCIGVLCNWNRRTYTHASGHRGGEIHCLKKLYAVRVAMLCGPGQSQLRPSLLLGSKASNGESTHIAK